MTFDELIDQGWADHDRDLVGVAARIEKHKALADSAERAARFASLTVHVVGKEGREWGKAARLVREVIARLAAGHEADPALVPALASLAVAEHLAGDAAGALATELRAAAIVPDDAAAFLVRVRMLHVEALLGAGRRENCFTILGPALDLAARLEGRTLADRVVAVVSNNVASAMLELPRTAELDVLMERTALAAREFWLKAGDWKNDARADYLLALVYNALGRHDQARAVAARGLETIRANGEEKVDEAFLRLAHAAALKGLGRRLDAEREIEAATAIGRGFEDDGLRSWFETELGKLAAGGPARS